MSRPSQNPRPEETPQPKPFPVSWLLKWLFAVCLLVWLLSSIDFSVFWQTLHSVHLGLFWFAAGLFFPGQLLASYRWHFLLTQLGVSLPFWTIVRYTLLGRLSSLFLPGMSSDIVRVVAITQRRQGKAIFAFSVLIDQIALFIGLLSCTLCGLVGSSAIAGFGPFYAITFSLLVFAAAIFVFLCRYRKQTVPDGQSCLARLLGRLPWIGPQLCSSLRTWAALPCLSFRTICSVAVLGLSLQLSYTIGGYLMARSMGIGLPVVDWIAISATVALVQLLPLTVGGLGVREGAFAGILALYHVPAAQSAAFSLTGFFIITCSVVLSWLLLESLVFRRAEREKVKCKVVGALG